jgi:uncharacterized protein YndB with AHSA1/START domain
MAENLVARASTLVDAPVAKVWDALVTPATIKRYMFGATVVSDWKKGSPIVWKGEWQGKKYEDKGVIQRIERPRVLEYTHYSPLSGEPDVPESYHAVTIELAEQGEGTKVSLAQDNNATEQARAHSEKNWTTMLDGLKKELEKK